MFGTVCLAAAVQADCVWVLRGPLRCFLPFWRQQDVCRFIMCVDFSVWRKKAKDLLTLWGVFPLCVTMLSMEH